MQFADPFRPWWALASGPGEICAIAGAEMHRNSAQANADTRNRILPGLSWDFVLPTKFRGGQQFFCMAASLIVTRAPVVHSLGTVPAKSPNRNLGKLQALRRTRTEDGKQGKVFVIAVVRKSAPKQSGEDYMAGGLTSLSVEYASRGPLSASLDRKSAPVSFIKSLCIELEVSGNPGRFVRLNQIWNWETADCTEMAFSIPSESKKLTEKKNHHLADWNEGEFIFADRIH